MYLNTRIFPTTGYARVPLFMFIRRELGGTVQEVYFSLHTVGNSQKLYMDNILIYQKQLVYSRPKGGLASVPTHGFSLNFA